MDRETAEAIRDLEPENKKDARSIIERLVRAIEAFAAGDPIPESAWPAYEEAKDFLGEPLQ